MPNPSNKNKRLYYISPENRKSLEARAPIVSGGIKVDLPLNSVIQRYAAFASAGLRRVLSALPDEQDQRFIRFALSALPIDDLTVCEDPCSYLTHIAEVASEYEDDEEKPFTSALLPTLRRFGPLEALGLVDWIEQERVKKS